MLQLLIIITPILIVFFYLKRTNNTTGNNYNEKKTTNNIIPTKTDNNFENNKEINPDVLIKTGISFRNIFNNSIALILINIIVFCLLNYSQKNIELISIISILVNLLFSYFLLKNIYDISEFLKNPFK